MAFVREALSVPNVRYATRQFGITAPLLRRHVPNAATLGCGKGDCACAAGTLRATVPSAKPTTLLVMVIGRCSRSGGKTRWSQEPFDGQQRKDRDDAPLPEASTWLGR